MDHFGFNGHEPRTFKEDWGVGKGSKEVNEVKSMMSGQERETEMKKGIMNKIKEEQRSEASR